MRCLCGSEAPWCAWRASNTQIFKSSVTRHFIRQKQLVSSSVLRMRATYLHDISVVGERSGGTSSDLQQITALSNVAKLTLNPAPTLNINVDLASVIVWSMTQNQGWKYISLTWVGNLILWELFVFRISMSVRLLLDLKRSDLIKI